MLRQKIHVSASATSGSVCNAAEEAARVASIFQRMAASLVEVRGAAAAIESAVRATSFVRS